MHYLKLIFLISLIASIAGCEENTSKPRELTVTSDSQKENNSEVTVRGDRLLGLGVNTGSIGFEKAMKVARGVGLNVIELPVQWDEIEKKQGKYKNEWLDIANSYYPSLGIKVLVSFNPIDTNSLRVPADLIGKPLDDPEVIARYNNAADYVLERLKDTDLVGFVIGNEVDGILGDNAQKWAEYARFFKATSEHVRKQRPGIPIGAKVMFYSLVEANAAQAATINTHADVIMSTYYPLKSDFTVKDISSISQDMDMLASLPGSKPIFLAEVGCPSSEHINSSMEKQSQFIHEMFSAWDNHHERIQLINFIWLHDISKAEVKSYKDYYGVSSLGFAEYLGTLGLRTDDGQDKPAFKVLRDEVMRRNW